MFGAKKPEVSQSSPVRGALNGEAECSAPTPPPQERPTQLQERPTQGRGQGPKPQEQALKSQEVKFSVDTSRGFSKWLASQNVSLALTTYQVGKIIFFGTDENGALWTFNRNIGRCLGLSADASGFWVSSDTQLYRFTNAIRPGERGPGGADAFFTPRMSFFTGDLDIHDVGLARSGQPIFVNTLFNCLARPSATHSFAPVWKPPFISRFAAEDRCHLNGLAMRDGQPAFVTAVSTSDVYDGWRGHRRDGGVLIDVASGAVVCSGLSMPHSPRWHNGRVWLHNSGAGEFGSVNLSSGRFEPLAFCPGYLRGLDFIGDVAVACLSLPRGNKTFSGLALEDRLAADKIEARCGLYFIDLKTGDIVHSVILGGLVTELYDVSVLRGVRQPAALGPSSEEMRRTLSIET